MTIFWPWYAHDKNSHIPISSQLKITGKKLPNTPNSAVPTTNASKFSSSTKPCPKPCPKSSTNFPSPSKLCLNPSSYPSSSPSSNAWSTSSPRTRATAISNPSPYILTRSAKSNSSIPSSWTAAVLHMKSSWKTHPPWACSHRNNSPDSGTNSSMTSPWSTKTKSSVSPSPCMKPWPSNPPWNAMTSKN